VIAVSRRPRERKRAARGATTGWRPRGRLSAARRGATEMAKTAKKIVFSRSRDIPFNKLVLSASNVRRIRPEYNVEELAEDIARREDLVQGLNVRGRQRDRHVRGAGGRAPLPSDRASRQGEALPQGWTRSLHRRD
jgi:hypothetical protein